MDRRNPVLLIVGHVGYGRHSKVEAHSVPHFPYRVLDLSVEGRPEEAAAHHPPSRRLIQSSDRELP
jgi:hypothetical protein